MYKDVKKKLLSVALCVCMIIGMVQVVPKAKADATVTGNTVTITGTNPGGIEETCTLVIESSILSYTGSPQAPVVSYANDSSGKQIDGSANWKLTVSDGDDGTIVGTHTCFLAKGTTGDYSFDPNDTRFTYTISQARITDYDIEMKSNVVSWKSEGVEPALDSVSVQLNGKVWLTLTKDVQYTVTSNTGTGRKTSTLTITDPNIDIANSAPTNPINYIVGYPLEGTIEKGTTEREMGIEQPTEGYTGTVRSPRIRIKNKNGWTLDVSQHPDDFANNFTVKYFKRNLQGGYDEIKAADILAVGKYQVQVTANPGSGQLGSYWYTGTFTGDYEITAKDNSTLRVIADDVQNKTKGVTIYENGAQIKPVLVYEYVGGGTAVRLENLQVWDGDSNVTDQFEQTYNGETGVGNASVTLTPIPNKSNYGSPIYIDYYITSGIEIREIQFEGYDPGDTNIFYTGNPIIPTSYKVVNKNGTAIGYTVEYGYQVDGSWEGHRTTDPKDPELAKTGLKRLYVKGTGNYANAEAWIEYSVSAVDMSEGSKYYNDFTLELDPSDVSGTLQSGYYVYYNGGPREPRTVLTYGSGTNPKTPLTEGTDYRVDYSPDNHSNKGKVTVTVTALPNSCYAGSRSVTFDILPVYLDKAYVDGDAGGNGFSYTGKEIVPRIVLKDGSNYTYELQESDYTAEYYDLDKQEALTAPPRNVGHYRITLTNRNSNINGQTKALTYDIVKRDISKDPDSVFILSGVNGENREIEWTGGNTDPEVICGDMVKDTDFEVSYSNDTTPGPVSGAAVTITGKGNYTGTKTLHYTITARSLTNRNMKEDVSVDEIAGGGFKATITLEDTGSFANGYVLQSGSDYVVERVTYTTDKKDTTDYKDSLDHLPKAGAYQAVLTGTGYYKDSKTVTIGCGYDISDAKIKIADPSASYTGKPITPSGITLEYRDEDGKRNSVDYVDGANSPFFIEFERDDDTPKKNANISAGQVFVVAVGNPAYGFYGTTKSRAEFTIGALDISNYKSLYAIDITDTRGTDKNGTYTVPFLNVSWTDLDFTVKDDATGSIELRKNTDYTWSYDGECISQGSYRIVVTGTGNYTGTIDKWFDVGQTSIAHPNIKLSWEGNSSASYAEGQPEPVLKLGSYTLVKGADKDYTYNVSRIASPSSIGWDNCYKYVITGRNNFENSREEYYYMDQTPFDAATSEESWAPGQVYINRWNMEELFVDPSHIVQKTPTDFTLSYKKSDGTIKTLGEKDFEIVRYGTNKQPGTAGNDITLKGINGYSNNEQTFPVTLYTNIALAQFNTGSTIISGGSISLTKLEEAMNTEGGLANLVSLKNLWPDEQGGRIDPKDYKVTFADAGYTPEIGTVTFIISGAQQEPRYYGGSMQISMTVTGALDTDNIRLVVGDNNTVKWEGEEITPANTPYVVYDGTKELKGGLATDADKSDYDYTISFRGTEIGLCTATITGINKYAGEMKKDFKITYPLSDLAIKLQDENGDWKVYDGGSLSYLYKIDTLQNRPEIELYYTKKGSLPDDQWVKINRDLYSIRWSGYETAGDNNARIMIATSEDDKYKDVLLGASRTISYTLRPISLDDVLIDMSTPEPTFTGNALTASDIGLTLTYGTYSLTDADYKLTFYNNTNANDKDAAVPPRVVITAMGNFTGKYEASFTIRPLPIYSADIESSVKDIIYTGNPETPELTLTQKTGKVGVLKPGIDYEIFRYLDETKTQQFETPFTKVGNYYVRVVGKGNYETPVNNMRDIPYRIVERQMEDGLEVTFVDGMPDCVYDGKAHTPEIQVVYNKQVLSENVDYTVAYENNINAGTATVKVTGNGSFSGTKEINFTIQAKDIAGADMEYRNSSGAIFEDELSYEWTNDAVRPEISIYDLSLNNAVLAKGEGAADYTVTYYDENEDGNTQRYAGKVSMIITGTGNYGGTKEFTYYIGEDISKSYVLVNGKKALSTAYNGLTQAPKESDISVAWNSDVPQEDENGEKCYRIAYYYYEQGSADRFDSAHMVDREQIVNAGTYYVAVVGEPTKGTYAKSDAGNSCTYKINQRSISPSYVLVSGYDATYYYVGSAIEPQGITVEDTDLPVAGEESGSRKRTVKLIPGIDYDLNYRNNTMAGKASIVVTGKGNYTGERVAYFNILSSSADGNNTWDGSSEGSGSISNGTTSIAASDIILGYDNSDYNCMMYTGYERTPTVTINGISTNEFTITASNNIRPGIATLMITGNGSNFTGTIIKKYKIKANLAAYGSIAAIEDQVYTGYQITPHVTLTCGGNVLNQGSDYTLTYLNNTSVGKATVMATATNDSNYIGTASGSFNISNTAGGMEITGYASTYTYTGYAITPDIVVTMSGRVLNRGTDYTVSYSNNTNVGTATMTVTGIGSFSGTKTINYTIEAKNIENCLTTAVDDYQYTGSTYTPNISVTDSSTGKTLIAGTDYTITYSNNTNPGTASITVTALSKNYSGSKVIPFKIFSAAVSGLRVSSIKNNSMKLSWTPQDYADGYQICNSSNRVIATTSKNSYTIKRLTSCTTYRYKVRSYVENADGSVSYGNFSTAVSAKTLLNTPKLKAKSTSRGRVTLTWSKVSKASGYEIYYSTKKNGVYTRLKTVSKSSSRKFVDKGLASGEKYYYTIRAYRTTNGVKTYSSYNTIKSVKVK